jgi:hypothetical protein
MYNKLMFEKVRKEFFPDEYGENLFRFLQTHPVSEMGEMILFGVIVSAVVHRVHPRNLLEALQGEWVFIKDLPRAERLNYSSDSVFTAEILRRIEQRVGIHYHPDPALN